MNLINTVAVTKLKEKFSDKICGLYNVETYYIEDCTTNNSKYSIAAQLRDFQLDIFLEENNTIEIKGKLVKFCSKDVTKKKVKLKNITDGINQPDVTINNNNYIIEDDTWESFQL